MLEPEVGLAQKMTEDCMENWLCVSQLLVGLAAALFQLSDTSGCIFLPPTALQAPSVDRQSILTVVSVTSEDINDFP